MDTNILPRQLSSGAIAVVCEKLPDAVTDKITFVSVKNSGQALGIIASNFFGNPSEKMKLTGVTGTNGKTTVATLLYKLFGALGTPIRVDLNSRESDRRSGHSFYPHNTRSHPIK